MPISTQDLADYLKNKNQAPGDYAVPKDDIKSQVNAMPNSDKLTKFEKWTYGKLPGVTKWMENNKIFGETYSDQLDKFNNSYIGKGLQYLDVFAEGLERTSGLVAQMQEPDFNLKDLQAAWYAGGLTYDMVNIPQITKDANGAVGLSVPADLGGVDGLTDARLKIKRMMELGLFPKEALERARDDYYGGLGALALRAQINDTLGHAIADPLNFITGALKPVQALKARRLAAMNKIVGGAEDIVTKADDIAKLVNSADNAADALKYADEAYQLAQLAGDSKRAAEYGQKAAELAQQAGRVEDVARYGSEVSDLSRIAGTAEEAAKYSDVALAALGKKQINTVDKIAIMLTGGDPFRPSALVQKLEKIPGLGIAAKAFQLTPESKAKELLTMFSDNIGSNVISRLWNSPTAETDFVNLIHRMKKGATGIEYGHAMMTMEGRTIQSFISSADFNLNNLAQTYKSLEKERNLLKTLSDAVGEGSEKLLRLMDENPEALMKMISNKAATNPLLAELLQTGVISPDSMRALSKIFPEGVPYNKEMFFAQAMDTLETAMMRQAVVQFGVKAKGTLTRWSDALKSAESLAFLRLSPAYPIRNKINNDITMIARGLTGFIDDTGIDNFWKNMGFTPQRLGGEALSGEAGIAKAMGGADDVIQQALKGGNYGTPEKIKDFFKNIDLGVFDTAKAGGKFEEKARRRATTLGAMQYLRQYFQPKSFKEYVSPQLFDAISDISPDLAKNLDGAIRSSGAVESKLDELLGKDLSLNVDSLIDNASARLGTDVRQVIGHEALEYLHQKLPSAIDSGSIDAFKTEFRQVLNNHVEDLFQKQIENVVEHTKAQAVAGGPNVWNQKLAEAQDIFWGAHIEHSTRMPEATRLAREATASGDFKLARALWEQEAEDARMFYDRAFRRVDAYIQGLEEGTAELAKRGAKMPFKETRQTFKKWKGMWEDFFKQKNSMYDNFWKEFEAAPKGKKPNIDDVRTKIDSMFNKNIEMEDEFSRVLDDTVANMIDDPEIKQAFINSRDMLGQLRRQDKQDVVSMYQKVADLAPEERQAAWNEFWQKRAGKYQDMNRLDKMSLAVQQGDPESIAMFQSRVQGTTEAGKFNIYQMANEYGIPSATTGGARNDRRILDSVNKYLPEGAEKFKNPADIPEDVARQAFDARNAEKGLQPPAQAPQVNPAFIADVKKVIPDQPPLDLAMDQMNYGRVMPMVDEVVSEAMKKRTPTLLKDLPENVQAEVMKAIKQVKNDFSATRYQAAKFGEWRGDSALLNYNRRTNFDNWLGHVSPFGFWSTNSMFKWAVESIDRPAMLTNYLRAKKFLATSGVQRDGMASRTKGKIRIDLPFAPDWMGEMFIDPLRVALPFDNWIDPFDRMKNEQIGEEGRTQRVLEQMLIDGQINQDEYEEATTNKSGATWDYANQTMKQNDESDRYDAFDFATSLQAPHAPLMWAYNAAFGDKKDIGPFAPMSRVARNAATLLGVEDWNNSKWNLEAKIRKQMGLPAFDKWDDYRIKRAASNLAGEGKLSPDEAKEAIAVAAMVESGKMSAEEAKDQSEAYRIAVARSNQEYTGGAGSFIAGLLGIPVTTVSQGENELRKLQDDFGIAYQKYKVANDSLEKYIADHPEMDRDAASDAWEAANPKLSTDADALGKFFDDNPEYETRLGLFDKPEEQIQKFMVDEVWAAYNALPKVNQNEVREHLGTEFEQAFLNSATRNTDAVSPELMAVWLKMMNVDPMGGLTADQRLLTQLYGPVQMTDKETAWRVEVFYDKRKQQFPNYFDLQSQYYEIQNKGQRKAFLASNPELKAYFDFRTNFMTQNPDLVPYLTDNQKAIDKAKYQSRQEGAVPTSQEIKVNIPPDVNEILTYYFQNGSEIPPVVMQELEYLGSQQGLTAEQMLNILQGQY